MSLRLITGRNMRLASQGGGYEIETAGPDPNGRSLNLLWGPIRYKVPGCHMRGTGRCGWTVPPFAVEMIDKRAV